MNSEIFKSLLIVISFLGLGITIFLVYQHYVGSTICDISKFISCNTVNRSSYSEFFGIPVAFFGVAYFILMIIFFSMYERSRKFLQYAIYFSIVAMVPSLLLTYVELAIIKAVCIFCESAKILIVSIILLSIYQLRREKVQPTFDS